MSKTESLSRFNDRIRPYAVWLLRIIVGGVFIISGFSKVVDPWGFVFKISEYLNVWGIDWLWREVVTCIAVILSSLEFILGVLLLTGCMRRSVCQAMALLMAFMLPLAAYVAIASPVADCGCFGEAFVISNTATFWKNVGLTIAILYLLFNNHKVRCLYPPLIQWMVIVASIVYCLVLAVVGMSVQPLIDFRPFKVGMQLVENDDASLTLIYEKDGHTKEFQVDELPDSSWTYVGRKAAEGVKESNFAVFDGEAEVTSDVIDPEGTQVVLVVSNPAYHQKARAGMANSINDYINLHGGSMFGVVALSPDSLDSWKEKTHPNFDVYTSDDTILKELVRGDAALVYLVDGVIKWKRNIYSLPGDFPDFEVDHNVLDDIDVVDSGYMLKQLTIAYLSILAFIFILGLMRIRKAKRTFNEEKFKAKIYDTGEAE